MPDFLLVNGVSVLRNLQFFELVFHMCLTVHNIEWPFHTHRYLLDCDVRQDIQYRTLYQLLYR